MNKKTAQLLFGLFLLFFVCMVGYVLSQQYKSKTSSAGPLSNYPFTQRLLGELTNQPGNQSTNQLSQIDRSQIFADKPLSTIGCNDCVTLLVTGDVLPARSINQKTVSTDDFLWPFMKTFEFLKNADITMINLETPLVADCPLKTDGMVFCGDQRNIAGLKLAGIDVVNMANNHAGNAGKQGVKDTYDLLTRQGFLTTGVGQPVYDTVKEVKFAFLGYNDIEKYGFIADVNEERVEKEISQARANADVIVVQFHWGEEYRYQPTARQRELARRVIDLGADLVVGNHPHWIEPVEWYKDKLIMYSHGNFIFDQMWSTETRQGVVGRYTFQGKNLVDVAFYPIFIENYGQPRWMEGKEKLKILDELKKESEKLPVEK